LNTTIDLDQLGINRPFDRDFSMFDNISLLEIDYPLLITD